jgi:apolipoprotein N-acyltransferase
LCAGIGLGVLGGLAPFESRLAGLVAAGCLILLGRGLVRLSWPRAVLWAALAAWSVAICAFHWVAVGLMNIAGLSFALTVPVFLLQGLLFNLKIVFVLLGARWLLRRRRVSWIWIFPALAAAGDLAFYQLFPWHFGSLTIGGGLVRQFAAVAGAYGLSAVLFFEAAVLIALGQWARSYWRRRRAGWRRLTRLRYLAPAALLMSVYAYGAIRIATLAREIAAHPPVRIGFLQPNTGPGYNEQRDDEAFAGRALNLVFNYGLKTILEGRGLLDLLIIPESAVPFYGTDSGPGNEGIYSPTFHATVAFLARYGDVDVLFNELAAVPPEKQPSAQPGEQAAASRAGYHNLATIVSRLDGRRNASYRKRRLVPFGEYVPGEAAFPILREIFSETSRYVPGSGPGTIAYTYRGDKAEHSPLPRLEQSDLAVLSDVEQVLADWPLRAERHVGYLQPLICYEGLFPDLVRDAVRSAEQPPDFLVNIVNDSWFGDVLENHHHESGARLRAVETGRYLVRPTLTGVSSVFDPLGREVIRPIPIGAQDVRVTEVPRLPDAWTLYIAAGNLPVWIFVVAVVGAALAWPRKNKILVGAHR